jgi:hypothetical protein
MEQTMKVYVPLIYWADEVEPWETGLEIPGVFASQFKASIAAVKWISLKILAELGGQAECCLALQDGETLFFTNGMWISVEERDLKL